MIARVHKALILWGFLVVMQMSTAQSELDHHKKYWYYKSRLNNDFLLVGNAATGTNFVVGDGHGQSIPHNSRHARSGIDNLTLPVRSRVDLDGGDETVQLGIYLSVLATEYKLLRSNNQDLTRVNHEIFCALNAINRLDFHAEPALDNTKAPDLNGFFIRSDIPERFTIDNYDHFNFFSFRINQATNDSSQVRGFTDDIDGHVIRGNGTYPTTSSEASQDQYYYLLMGLALTSKLVDANETDGANVFGYGSGETELATEAKNIADRLIKYMKTNNVWVIENPNTSNPVSIGASATLYAYALDNIGCFIKNGETMPYLHIPGITGYAYPHNLCTDYRNSHSASPFASASWQLLATGVGGALTPDQAGFYQILAGIGNNVYENRMYLDVLVQAAISALQTLVNNAVANASQNIQTLLYNMQSLNLIPQWLYNATQIAILAIQLSTQTLINTANSSILVLQQYLHPSILTNTTDERLLMNTLYSQIIYPNNCLGTSVNQIVHQGSGLYFGTYLRDILYGYGSFALPSNLAFIGAQPGLSHVLIKNDVETILDEAPCKGNFHYGFSQSSTDYANPSGDYWGGANFMDRIDRVWLKATCPEFRGDYAGLDYLLLHNLYYLVEGTNISFEDYIDRTESTNYPSGTNFSTANNPIMTKGAFEFIRPANAIAANGAVTFRAGKEIIPVPGAFAVAQGAEVAFEIEQYFCSGINDASMNKPSGPAANDPFESNLKNTTYIKPPVKQNDIHSAISTQAQNMANDLQKKNEQQVKKILGLIEEYNKIEVYPNPNSGHFSIRFKLTREDNVHLQIFNMLGQVVYEEKYITGSISLPVDLGDVNKGVYTAKMKFSNGKEEIRKISIQ